MKKAFTLAEVLITLGIIGIVAALTIPTIINANNQQATISQAKKAYSMLSQAISRMQSDGMIAYNYTCQPAANFKQDFMQYFNVAKDCGVSNCVPNSGASTVYKSISGVAGRADYFGENQFVTNDGFFIGMNTCLNAGVNEIWIAVDTNGYTTKPNVFGKDMFFFIIKPENKLVPNGAPGTWAAGNSGMCDKTINVGAQGVGCTSRILQNDVTYW